MHCSLRFALAGLLLLAADMAAAQNYNEALAAARRNDPIYASRLAEVAGARLTATQLRLSYIPSVGVTYNENDVNAGGRTWGAGAAQPLFNYDLWLQMRSARPFEARAEAQARSIDFDLQQRVFRTMAEIVRSRETLKTVAGRISALETQTQRARRMRELGQGTVTEVSDFETQLAIARADRLTVLNALQTAERAFTLLTSLQAVVETVSVSEAAPRSALREVEWYVSQAQAGNPQIQQARRDVELAEINLKRSRAEFLPKVTGFANYAKTEGLPGVDDTRIGVSLSVPLNSNYILNSSRSAVELRRVRESTRYVEESVASEARRLYATVQSLQEEVKVREQVIESAKLAVEGNLKGYQGGVKSNIDVVSAIQNLANAEVALVNSQLALGSAQLDLLLIAGGTQ